MEKKFSKGRVILGVSLSTIVFSILRMIQSFIPMVDAFVEWGWSLTLIIIISTMIQLAAAGLAVLIIMPPILGFKTWREWLPGYLIIDRKIVLTGFLSFVIFCTLSTVISLGMGIFQGDITRVFASPDLRPDPDVIGWGYFVLALVPGLWEELAFRGLAQSKLTKIFSTKTSILLSSTFFALFHLSLLLTQGPSQAIPKVVLSFFFGIGWGFLVVKTRSVIPGIIAHYLVDSLGIVFLGVDGNNPALATGFFILLTLLFPVFNIVLGKFMYRE